MSKKIGVLKEGPYSMYDETSGQESINIQESDSEAVDDVKEETNNE